MDSRYAWFRLAVAVTLSTLGGVGMWSFAVTLPAIQAEFGIDRASAALPYTLTTIGIVFGGMLMGRLVDRFGIVFPVAAGTISLSAGYVATSYAQSIGVFAALCGSLIGMIGSAALFGPLVANTSLWFDRYRGMAIALAACGNYFAGTIWPPILEHFVTAVGWRQTHLFVGLFCLATMLPLILLLRRPPPPQKSLSEMMVAGGSDRPLGLHPHVAQGLLVIAGISCCVAMAMPQVHIVAYCVDLGYGPARGAEMLSIMLGFGAVSRLVSGWILDRIGGLATALIGSTLQAFALAFYLPFDGLASLYVISAFFGLVQGGIVPSYAFIVRELFAAKEAGFRVSLTLSSTLAGMALGGWMSGVIFDATGSYQAALLNGIAWNLLNMLIILWLLLRRRPLIALASMAGR